jgi:hypothetical protein
MGKTGSDYHEREINSNAVLIEIPDNATATPVK